MVPIKQITHIKDVIPDTELYKAHRAYTLGKFTTDELMQEIISRKNLLDEEDMETCSSDIHDSENYCTFCGQVPQVRIWGA